MQNSLQSSKKINVWKAVMLKEQLNLSLIKSGYAPSHRLMDRITIIKKEEDEKFIERFYLDHHTNNQTLWLQSILFYDEAKAPVLVMERCDRVKMTIPFASYT